MAVSLGCMGASPAFAGTNSLAVSATQQTSTCTGVVVDDFGETVIGASVLVRVHPMVLLPTWTVSSL